MADYSYDGLNRRIRTIAYTGAVGEETESKDIRYLYDGWRSIAEVNLNDSNKLLARYVYGLRYLNELVHMDHDADGAMSGVYLDCLRLKQVG